ncbi:MAG: VirB8/TrbF family protein [Terriglobia bacterium]
MNQIPITSAPIDATEIPLFPDLEYHDRTERQNRILRWTVAVIAVAVMAEAVAIFTLAKTSSERIVEVVRINGFGKADAAAYRGSEYKPEAQEIRYFLSEWVRDRYSRLRATIEADFPKNYYFIESHLAAALMQKERRTIAEFLSGSGEQVEVQIDNVHITNLQSSPYTADVYLTKIFYSSPQQESRREKWIVRVNFTVDPKTVPNDLVPYNPLGLSIQYFREDQAFNNR